MVLKLFSFTTQLLIFILFNYCASETFNCALKAVPHCDQKYKYRTADGSCNNLKNPNYGQAHNCLERTAPAHYADCGDTMMPESIVGNVRHLSNSLLSESEEHKSPKFNNIFTFFGMFVGTDMAFIVQQEFPLHEIEYEPCCNQNETCKLRQCAPIIIPENDVYKSYPDKFRCINFIRSEECPTCEFKQRLPINAKTSFLDCETIYGNNGQESYDMREGKHGLLKGGHKQEGKREFMLDVGKNDQFFCGDRFRRYYPDAKNIQCFFSSDFTSNMLPIRAAVITVFFREHNRLATVIRQQCENLSHKCKATDEFLYQRARRLLNAKLQNIVYGEYIRNIFGEELYANSGLDVLKSGNTQYNENLIPRTTLEFSTGAFRSFGHSVAPNNQTKLFKNGTKIVELLNPMTYVPNFYENFNALLRGSLQDSMNEHDLHFADSVRIYFEQIFNDPRNHGIDLISIDLQRGRDHGIASYTMLVKMCFNRDIQTFKQLEEFISKKNIEKLKTFYTDATLVEAYVGIAAETHLNGALIGKVAHCIMNHHFHNIKFGDRFYFEHANQVGSFSKDELQYIRKTTMTSLLCLNVDEFADEKIQKKAFELASESNPKISCASVIEEMKKLEDKVLKYKCCRD